MSSRKIKDAKDLSTNELIYFKGHAQATYMSDGTTVEDAINNIEVTGGVVDTSNFVQYDNHKEITANIINGEYATSINIDKYGLIFGPSSKKTYVTVHAEGDGTKFLSDDGTYKTISNGSGTITGVSVNGTSVATSGVANIPAASTSAYGVTKLSSSTSSTSHTLAATANAVKTAYDLANGKQSKLVSGTNIKTINGESILGSGDIVISGGSFELEWDDR